jgi:hypothetical protein
LDQNEFWKTLFVCRIIPTAQDADPCMVIAGLDPAIHEVTPRAQPQGNTARNLIMDARVKSAYDESKIGAAGITW